VKLHSACGRGKKWAKRTLCSRGSHPSTRSCRLSWNSGCRPTFFECAQALGCVQTAGTSLRNRQLSRAIPTLAGYMFMPQGMGTDVWLSLTKDRYLQKTSHTTQSRSKERIEERWAKDKSVDMWCTHASELKSDCGGMKVFLCSPASCNTQVTLVQTNSSQNMAHTPTARLPDQPAWDVAFVSEERKRRVREGDDTFGSFANI
jgi:hypothetical protein